MKESGPASTSAGWTPAGRSHSELQGAIHPAAFVFDSSNTNPTLAGSAYFVEVLHSGAQDRTHGAIVTFDRPP